MAGDVLDTILADMAEPPRTKARHHKVSRILEVWKGQWGWSEVDVARALMHILPGAKAPPARQPPPGERWQAVCLERPSFDRGGFAGPRLGSGGELTAAPRIFAG